MAETKKMRKKDYFMKLRGIVEGDVELVTFIDHELELLEKKNSSKGTSKVQIENEKILDMLIEELTKIGSPVTITELMTKSEVVKGYVLADNRPLTNQKISALLNASDRVVKVTDKKKSYFSVAE